MTDHDMDKAAHLLAAYRTYVGEARAFHAIAVANAEHARQARDKVGQLRERLEAMGVEVTTDWEDL